MNNHMHSAPQLERKKRTENKERRITHYKINNLNGLEKYSLILIVPTLSEVLDFVMHCMKHVCVHVHVHVCVHVHVSLIVMVYFL